MAKSSGRLPKTALPAAAMICETASGSQTKFALPTPSKMPATGNTDTGSIMHLPIFWSRENAFLKDDIFTPMALRLKARRRARERARALPQRIRRRGPARRERDKHRGGAREIGRASCRE